MQCLSWLYLTLFAHCVATATAFQFTFSAPKSCASLDLSWTGGQPPFVLNVIPVFGIPFDISIPSNAFSNGAGSFSPTLLELNNSGVVLAMSDATGFGTGGISSVQELDNGKDAGNCAPADPLPWNYQTPNPLTQCQNYRFNSFDGTFTPPLTFTALVPGGSFLTLNGTEPFEWLTTEPAQTSMIFFGKDAKGKQGGSTGLLTVGQSNSKDCLTPSVQDISTTTNVPALHTSTAASGSSTSSPSNPDPSPHSSGTNIGLIAGVVCGLLGLVIICASSYFCLRARKQRLRQRPRFDVDGSSDSDGFPLGAGPQPFMLHSRAQSYTDDVEATLSQRPGLQSTRTPSAVYVNMKGGKEPPAEPNSRLIQHTDIEEMPREQEAELIELPPQYSASRRPISSLAGTAPDAGMTAASGSGPPEPSGSDVLQVTSWPQKS